MLRNVFPLGLLTVSNSSLFVVEFMTLNRAVDRHEILAKKSLGEIHSKRDEKWRAMVRLMERFLLMASSVVSNCGS